MKIVPLYMNGILYLNNGNHVMFHGNSPNTTHEARINEVKKLEWTHYVLIRDNELDYYEGMAKDGVTETTNYSTMEWLRFDKKTFDVIK